MMKLILFLAVVMFKCSRMSSAPADASTDTSDIKSGNENDYVANQPSYLAAPQPGMGYVSDVDDLGTTGVVFQFRRSIKSDNTEIEARRRSALDKGFMRFGRAGGNMLRFGRSPSDDESDDSRIRKNDKNMMRFGRSNYMRFGRGSFGGDSEPDEYNDASEMEDFIEQPVLRSPDNRHEKLGNSILRYGRSSSESTSNEVPDGSLEIESRENPERIESGGNNKKSEDRNMMRFGRANMMRFGRANPMRFGKRANMMRFGRDPSRYVSIPRPFLMNRQTRANTNDRNLMRLGRSGNLLRFGRNEKNLMRFGKRGGPQAVSSSTKIYCEGENCVVQEQAKQLTDSQSHKDDQLRELFGGEQPVRPYGEYINEK
jgi:FMRFamide related peptide family